MKKILIFLAILSLITSNILAQTYDLKFIEVNNQGTNGGNYDVKVQIQGSSAFKLGASNITFNFNTAGLSNPTLLTAHNFNGIYGAPPFVYGTMTVTNPNPGVASINIVFSQTDEANADEVPTTWKDVATVRFTIDNNTQTSQLSFRSANPSPTVVFKVQGADATFTTTQLNAGTWFSLDNPLPVELTTFTVKNKKGSAVDLLWETATEVNNYGFEVERAIKTNNVKDASTPLSINWEKIGFVEGAGNSNSPKKYSFTDKNLTGGSHFVYRLKQIDVDGTFEYSDEVEIEVLPTKFELSQNYPNPFNPSTTIKFSLPENSKVRLDIYNMIGELVTTLVNKELEAGFQTVQFNASNLASGIYLYRLSTSKFSKVRKMMLLK